MTTIGGKIFTKKIIEQIQKLVLDDPDISRRQLSLRVCEMLDWYNPAGKPQEVSCRKALLQLHRSERITLPELKRKYAFRTPKNVEPPPITPIEGALAELGGLKLVQVVQGKLSPVWRGMLDAYHYLKSGPLCGAQIRYLVHSETAGWVGALSFSACSLRVKPRDEWIGWTEAARKENINKVVSNSRFLIPPMVKVKGLASHILSMAEKQLADDWKKRYTYRPVLLETYVECGRFTGSCYAGAGWSRVGKTSGRGRKEVKKIIPKEIFMKPICDSWRTQLCSTTQTPAIILPAQEQEAPKDWIEEEFGRADFGDRRLTARLLKMTGQFFEHPRANIPQTSGSKKEMKAAYRFLDNSEVDWSTILRSHIQATTDRLHEHQTVLVATDTTTLNYTSHAATEGLGYICDNKSTRGIIIHDTLCFTPEGTPLGLLDVQCWIRETIGSKKDRKTKPIEQKESYKWIKAYRAVCEAQKQCRTTQLVMVADREGDIHELFCERLAHKRNAELLVRAERSRNRKVIAANGDYDYLWTHLEAQPILTTRKLLVPPREDRPARLAELHVRSMKTTLKPPRAKKDCPEITLSAVYAIEHNPPEGVAPLEWMLLSTLDVTSASDALTQLEGYAKRWGIEVYHRIFKSGCNVEGRQLGSLERICNCLAIDMVVAWRIFFLTMQGREAPELDCALYFSENEWKALSTFVNKIKTPPSTPPTLNEAIALLGRLGGHLGRVGDGNPGSEVLWRGMTRLADISEAYRLYA
ncbi:MAG: IS4 family transposase [Proteobacteria bacterium]|nr:IS4 family transposase [Pseudomonadota bacterium]